MFNLKTSFSYGLNFTVRQLRSFHSRDEKKLFNPSGGSGCFENCSREHAVAFAKKRTTRRLLHVKFGFTLTGHLKRRYHLQSRDLQAL